MAQNAHPEQTIRSEIEFRGIGLHSGAEVSMRLVPAPAGSGIVFRRTDLDGFEIPATGRNVAKVSYATSLMRGSVLISTTEHLLSALIGYGVDNVIVEVDNLELPILDGSALPYVEAFHSAGLKQQRRRREYLRILKEVEVREGGKFIGVYPGTGYGIDYTIDFPQPIGSARFQGDLESGDYARLIAPARTVRLQGGRGEAARYGADSRGIGGVRHYSDRAGRAEWAAALCRRVCAAQGPGPDRRSGAGGTTNPGTRGGGARGPRHAYRAGAAIDARPVGVGAGACLR